MIMTQDEIDKMHEIQLELLVEVDRICKKNQISYSIIAGTLLGAVRHKGYIPWDKDADVALLRPEYEKFVKACETDINGDLFYFQDHKVTDGYRWGYGKIRKHNTIWLRDGQEEMPYLSGVGIDVFPLDHAPNSLFFRKIHDQICTVVRKFGWCRIGKTVEKKASLRFLYSLMDLIPEKKALGFLDRWIRFSNRKETDIVRILTFPTPNNGFFGYYKRWYENLEDIHFEGIAFPAIKDYDEYLTFKFGNYMDFPPEKERVVDGCSYFSFTHGEKPENTKDKKESL